MKWLGVIVKSLREQIRSFWVLLLTLSMGPLFIFIYFLITESSRPNYKVLILNDDSGVEINGEHICYGKLLTSYVEGPGIDSLKLPFIPEMVSDRTTGTDQLKNNKADALVVIHPCFSKSIESFRKGFPSDSVSVEFVGDLTKTGYLISAVWLNELIHEFTLGMTHSRRMVNVKETPLGKSGVISEFDMLVPGILILSLIMLMFTASIAFVGEVEHKTILRLKMSAVTTAEYLGGITVVQAAVGLVSLLATLGTALILGFHYSGSLTIMILIGSLTSISIVAFSLIIAAVTKSANEVLVVGNFPMFLFMFFTGAAFPVKSKPLFTLFDYPVNFQGLMTPTHAISALNKTLVMNMDLTAIIPELTAIVILTVLYFMTGAFVFYHRHLKIREY